MRLGRIAVVRIVLVAATLAACAGAPPSAEAPRAVRPLGAYASDPFVPVNLYLNANEQVAGDAAAMIEYAAARLRDSEAFVRVDRGVQRWPITIQARYALEQPAAGVGRRALAMLTLGLVPLRLDQTHRLSAEVFAEPDQLASMDLSVEVHESVRPFDDAARRRAETAAVDALLERLVAEIAQRKLVPRWSAFKPEPRKKPKPLERPT